MEGNSEASYCERETWDECGSYSSLSQLEEVTPHTNQDDAASLRVERDSLARALATERARAASAARAQDARLAELHGVIAELVRRRAQDKHSRAIPEEELSEECESTTQPAGELDNDVSHTEPNDTSSNLSPAELPSPHEPRPELPDDTTDTSARDDGREVNRDSVAPSDVEIAGEGSSDMCLSTARCGQLGGHTSSNCGMQPPSPGRCESRRAKVASRVRLRRAQDLIQHDSRLQPHEPWYAEAAERLAAEARPAPPSSPSDTPRAPNDWSELSDDDLVPGVGECVGAGGGGECVWRARALRAAADRRLLQCALAACLATARRLSMSMSALESSCVCVCGALTAADRALETYDVLLALAETSAGGTPDERCAAEAVARRVLRRLDAGPAWGAPLLPPGPWAPAPNEPTEEDTEPVDSGPWTDDEESRLRQHAARLKRETVALRALRPPPRMYSPHDLDEDESFEGVDKIDMVEMEAAVMMQEALRAREERLVRGSRAHPDLRDDCQPESSRGRKKKERHWLETQASETDL